MKFYVNGTLIERLNLSYPSSSKVRDLQLRLIIQSMKENYVGTVSVPFPHIPASGSFYGQLGGGLCFINNYVDDNSVNKMSKIHPDQCHKATEEADVQWIYHPLVCKNLVAT